MWSLGCIFAELVLCQPLLPGRGELDQIDRIFKLLGTPSEHTWPGVAQLPNMKRVGFKPQPFSHLRDKFKRGASFTSETALSQHGLDLLEKMLIMDPGRRITAKQATAHKYFREQASLKPSFPLCHTLFFPFTSRLLIFSALLRVGSQTSHARPGLCTRILPRTLGPPSRPQVVKYAYEQ